MPVSLVAHFVFCPRRAWLEASGESVESSQIEVGTSRHRRVDDPKRARALETTAIAFDAPGLGVTGRCDVLKVGADGLEVVEFKATPVRRRAEVTEPHRVQLALQVMALEEMGHRVSSAAVYFPDHECSVDVQLTRDVRDQALEALAATKQVIGRRRAPAAREDVESCRFCSHVGVCLPQRGPGLPSIRASDPDGEIVHVTTQGARLQMAAGRIVVVKGEEQLASLPVERVVGLVLHGNVDVSSSTVRELLFRRRTIVWCSNRGGVVGWATSSRAPNGGIRVEQGRRSAVGDLPIARAMVFAKIHNQRVFLRRNGSPLPATLDQLAHLAREARACSDLARLFGVEGSAAQLYFADFATLLRRDEFSGLWDRRIGRGAGDPINAALNFVYALLMADCVRAIAACGLDPHAGFLHSPSRNKPAFALDLMEEFRAPVADSAVVRAINNGELQRSMFMTRLGAARLTDVGRQALVRAYEERCRVTITHPVLGYSVSWRRAMETQARMILAVLEGSRPEYVGMRIR